ncbi:hypothetical protein [Neorhizobium sp. JUb45]|uniref:hypothetical protein n=1 Tax=Neorhizobium sp. JUb45 TaxID=2485113 RepID=UPI0010D23DBC|nr:hypothetical protein [Neorhizobium sp. JUb45]TCQ95366.1 hypothetical protein EDF70_12414 [Neorhizobium sp. JUb45]
MQKHENDADNTIDVAFAQSATVELLTHYAVLVFVLVPVLALVFPGMLFAIGATMLASVIPDNAVSQWLQNDRYSPLIFAGAIALVIGVASVLVERRQLILAPPGLRELSGEKGLKLHEMVAAMWRRLAPDSAPPSIRWFPALDIAAYATTRDARPELQVSAGLWRAATSDDPIATAIVAHELSHLIYRDPRSLFWLNIIVVATRGILAVTAGFGAVIVLLVLGYESLRILDRGDGSLSIVFACVRIVAAAGVILILIPLGWLALRRQVAFVTSLIEVRADVAGALWTGGLRQYTQIFATHERVQKTTDRDLLTTILSPSFSHIPQRERLSILASPSLLVTPKLEFFLLSVVLVFLLPINFATPYLLDGVLNYLAIQVLAAALNAVIVSMLIVGSTHGPVLISARRLFTLAIASCVVTALPRINLEPLSYLPFSWLMGFGGATADWSTLGKRWLGLSEQLRAFR